MASYAASPSTATAAAAQEADREAVSSLRGEVEDLLRTVEAAAPSRGDRTATEGREAVARAALRAALDDEAGAHARARAALDGAFLDAEEQRTQFDVRRRGAACPLVPTQKEDETLMTTLQKPAETALEIGPPVPQYTWKAQEKSSGTTAAATWIFRGGVRQRETGFDGSRR